MSLTLHPNPEVKDDYLVMLVALRVGRIYRRRVALLQDFQWLWSIDGVPHAGLSETRGEAEAEFPQQLAEAVASSEVAEHRCADEVSPK